jgi:hypothetical protein
MSQPQTKSTLNRLWCGLLAVTCVGCQTYSPYGYGGYSGGYPMYNQPGQVMPYGGPGIQSGTTVMPVPEAGYPGGYPAGNLGPGAMTPNGYPPGGNYGIPPQGADISGDNLGPAGQFPGASAPPRPNVPLPPTDPNYLNGPGTATPPRTRRPAPNSIDPGGPADFNGDQSTGAEKATQKLKKMETSSPGVPDAAMIRTVIDGTEFPPPVTRNNRSGIIQTSQHVDAGIAARDLRPYGRAPNGQAWFRGLVDFDEQENAWYLIYNPEPDASDKQGGTITLVEHPHLKLFKPDEVILVEGQFDPSETDRYGNPKYRAEVVRRLIP